MNSLEAPENAWDKPFKKLQTKIGKSWRLGNSHCSGIFESNDIWHHAGCLLGERGSMFLTKRPVFNGCQVAWLAGKLGFSHLTWALYKPSDTLCNIPVLIYFQQWLLSHRINCPNFWTNAVQRALGCCFVFCFWTQKYFANLNCCSGNNPWDINRGHSQGANFFCWELLKPEMASGTLSSFRCCTN